MANICVCEKKAVLLQLQNLKDMKKNKKSNKVEVWWQSMREEVQQKVRSSKKWARAHVEDIHRKQESYGDEDSETNSEYEGIQGRITFFTAIRILLAELGEVEYWRTLWQLLWRPGYVISDYINGKRRRYLKPFQFLIGTTIMLGIALAIVPAKVEKEESMEVRFNRVLTAEKGTFTPEQEARLKPVHFVIHYMEKYRRWREEHLAFGLLSSSILSVFFAWLLFRKSPRRANPYMEAKGKQTNYNFPEILTVVIFVAAQLQFVNTVWVLIAGWIQPTLSLNPFVFPGYVTWIIMFIDYQQLFGRKWYSTLWRTLFCII